MEEVKYILEKHRIGWNAPLIFVTKKEVITLSPELILNRVLDLRTRDRNHLLNKFLLIRNNRQTVLNYLNKLGSCIVNTKL